ncbi:hypothetical protein F4777DRAFT_421598 [Nemania sp. FL0916]|nr:hypothetical protein F4777DRAFT_421598 [Nemania sp. FL0916]
MSAASESGSTTVAKATQTEDDLAEIKTDIKKIVEAVQSLVPQPKPVPKTERQFCCDVRHWERMIKPTPEKMASYVDALLSMLYRDKFGHLRERYRSIVPFQELFIPSFVDRLVLLLPDNLDISLAYEGSEMATRIRNHIMSQRATPVDIPKNEMPKMARGATAAWNWDKTGLWDTNDLIYLADNDYTGTGNFCPWTNCGTTEIFDQATYPVSSRGYGTICFIRHPIENGVLSFPILNFILSQIGRWTYNEVETWLYFLGVFSGQWSQRFERWHFSSIHMCARSTQIRLIGLQVHFRCFGSISFDDGQGTDGLKCDRERGEIRSEIHGVAPLLFEEKRISIFGLLSGQDIPSGNFGVPPFYSVVILSDFECYPDRNWEPDRRYGLEGTIAFQSALFTCVGLWQGRWNAMLDEIDERVNFRLDHTMQPEQIRKWMFDNNFERATLYVTILQVLRLFAECISTVSDDIRTLDDTFLKSTTFPITRMRQDECRAMESNWESVKEFQKQAERSLLGRISEKTEEVKGLRDVLFGATSLRAANNSSELAISGLNETKRSISMGRYVLVFTIVTILYLPPSFISTVFSLDIFQKEAAQSKWEYKTAIVSVSLVTYLLAFISIIAVDWIGFKARCSAGRKRLVYLSDRLHATWLFTVAILPFSRACWARVKNVRLNLWKPASEDIGTNLRAGPDLNAGPEESMANSSSRASSRLYSSNASSRTRSEPHGVRSSLTADGDRHWDKALDPLPHWDSPV